MDSFKEELLFFKIPQEDIDRCEHGSDVLNMVLKLENEAPPTGTISQFSEWGRKLMIPGSFCKKVLGGVDMIATAVYVLILIGMTDDRMVGTTPSSAKTILRYLSAACVIWFVLHYTINFSSATNKRQYCLGLLSVIDFLVVCSFVLDFFSGFLFTDDSVQNKLTEVRILIGVGRQLCIARYSSLLYCLGMALKKSGKDLLHILYILIIVILVFSSAAYFFEVNSGLHIVEEQRLWTKVSKYLLNLRESDSEVFHKLEELANFTSDHSELNETTKERLKYFQKLNMTLIFEPVYNETNHTLTGLKVADTLEVDTSSWGVRVEEKSRFSSIPASLWWGFITVTTVGYGDIAPRTAYGKLISAVLALTGIPLIAIPLPLIMAKFNVLYKNKKIEEDTEKKAQTLLKKRRAGGDHSGSSCSCPTTSHISDSHDNHVVSSGPSNTSRADTLPSKPSKIMLSVPSNSKIWGHLAVTDQLADQPEPPGPNADITEEAHTERSAEPGGTDAGAQPLHTVTEAGTDTGAQPLHTEAGTDAGAQPLHTEGGTDAGAQSDQSDTEMLDLEGDENEITVVEEEEEDNFDEDVENDFKLQDNFDEDVENDFKLSDEFEDAQTPEKPAPHYEYEPVNLDEEEDDNDYDSYHLAETEEDALLDKDEENNTIRRRVSL